jgi:hypothetical protein
MIKKFILSNGQQFVGEWTDALYIEVNDNHLTTMQTNIQVHVIWADVTKRLVSNVPRYNVITWIDSGGWIPYKPSNVIFPDA